MAKKEPYKPDASSSVGRLGWLHVIVWQRVEDGKVKSNAWWFPTRGKAQSSDRKLRREVAAEGVEAGWEIIYSGVRPCLVELQTPVQGTLKTVDLLPAAGHPQEW